MLLLSNYRIIKVQQSSLYLIQRGIFAYGRPKDGVGSPHQKLVNSIGSEQGEHIVGGIMLRKPDGSFQFNEHSGHFGINWDDQKRVQFSSFMQKETGIKVDNVGYNGKD